MLRLQTPITLIVLTAVALPATILAQSENAHGRRSTAAIRLMRHVDRDGDRHMDPNELAAAQELAYLLLDLDCEQADADHDGEVSLDELESAVAALYDEASDGLSPTDDQAVTMLNRAFSWPALLEQLQQDGQYAAELEALRAAVENLDDVDVVTTHVLRYPTRYPHLTPVLRYYRRFYLPARWRLHHHYRLHHPAAPGVKHEIKKHAHLKATARPRPGPKPATVRPKGARPRPAPRRHR